MKDISFLQGLVDAQKAYEKTKIELVKDLKLRITKDSLVGNTYTDFQSITTEQREVLENVYGLRVESLPDDSNRQQAKNFRVHYGKKELEEFYKHK